VTSAEPVDFYQPIDAEDSRDMGYDPVWRRGQRGLRRLDRGAAHSVLAAAVRGQRRADLGRQHQPFNPQRNEDLFWIMSEERDRMVVRFGNLSAQRLKSSRRLEIVPYGTTNATLTGDGIPRTRSTTVATWRRAQVPTSRLGSVRALRSMRR